MGSWYDENGRRFWSILNPALWSTTKQSFASRINENLKFLKNVKADFLSGFSDPQVGQEKNGGFILEVVGSTPSGSTGYYRTLADKDEYSGTLVSGGFLNRYVIVMGSFMFLSSPSNALPGGSNEGLLISNLLGSEGGDVKPLFGTWYTGSGVSRPISGGSTRVFQKTGTYNNGTENYTIDFFAGSSGGQDDGRLMFYEAAPHGVAFHFTFLLGPRCETG